MTILPLTYLPSIEWMAHLLQEPTVIDLGEHFIKRTERNRTSIMSANGVLDLSVHIKNANRPRTPMQSIKVDYTMRWQHQHWMAILSAYKSSPYFDHFAPYLEPIFKREYQELWQLNLDLIKVMLRLMGSKAELNISHTYINAQEDDLDLRPKTRSRSELISLPRYTQVFSDREPFAENLSTLDILMCEGRSALPLLLNAKIL